MKIAEMPLLSVIMPALNEQDNICSAMENTLKALDDFRIPGELIVVNDGSSDNTRKLAERIGAGDTRVSIINHDSPQGFGGSFWDGLDHAGGGVITILPGDNENDPWEILRYYRMLEHVDIVIPFLFNKEVRSKFRNILSAVYRFAINTTFAVNFNYTNGTIIYRKSILDELDYRSSGFFFQTDILIRAVKRGYLFAEVPYKLGQRQEGISKAVTFPSLIQVLKGYFRLINDHYFNSQEKEGQQFSKDSMTAERRDKSKNRAEVSLSSDTDTQPKLTD